MTALKNQAIQTALTGNWENAIVINKKLLKENPQEIDTLNRLALAYMLLGKAKEAKSTYQKVLRIDPLNSIALKNVKLLKEKGFTLQKCQDIQINNKFLEETGKTKIVELVNLAQPKIIQNLRTGQCLNLCIKRSKIFLLATEKQYVGVLPDDLGRRLIKFLKSGNLYEAYVKSANAHHLIIFIKELKRSPRYKNQPSFIAISENTLEFDKEGRFKNSFSKKESDLDEDEETAEEE